MSLIRLFDWSLKLQGFPMREAEKDFDTVRQLDANGIIQYQEQACWKIFKFHQQNNPYYQQFLSDKDNESNFKKWSQVPIIKKADMQVPIEQRLSNAFSINDVFINNTSGSSGVPFFFAKDKYCHARTWACVKHRFGVHGIDFNTSWQARFYGIPLTKKKYYKEKFKDVLSHRVRFPVFNLEDKVCAAYVERFRRTNFEYLNGYASSLVLFAKYCVKNNVVLKQVCPTLKACFTTSEICSPGDREILRQGFGVTIVNEYGAAELDLLAVEDQDGDWLMNEENLFIEIVDDNDQPVEDGETGRVVVTAMFNKAIPMIRYELGDIASIVPNSRKGIHRKLDQLQGRVNDIATLPSGKRVPGLTFYYVTKSMLEKGGSMKEFIIRQETVDQFVIEFVASEALTQAEKSKVQEMMDLYLEPGLSIKFEQKEKIERTKAGKLRQFQTLVK
jgi:phenylacetate-CoA ligase